MGKSNRDYDEQKAPTAVHQNENGKWYFWDECWADEIGPYGTRKLAEEALLEYVDWLHNDDPSWKKLSRKKSSTKDRAFWKVVFIGGAMIYVALTAVWIFYIHFVDVHAGLDISGAAVMYGMWPVFTLVVPTIMWRITKRIRE